MADADPVLNYLPPSANLSLRNALPDDHHEYHAVIVPDCRLGWLSSPD